ncbi:pentapeptide repeat-containing protein [Blastopirellula sp. JC732]|uniref:Pentapeptide repeat-containing protein n=1 Tax=Blastopirellula sediminis TaxID=2894196 RepID=A0A9X1MQS1_9BACT|nr:pentapeptide repeat-containing protein [Blastopirellula sediminis]MCC9604927.1 pentapeptide repeat-containing protein [Blastopirellula sediminis]MCC9631773.1 pentapeptide repeat-containing protein [Blastopirellula sediminis]
MAKKTWGYGLLAPDLPADEDLTPCSVETIAEDQAYERVLIRGQRTSGTIDRLTIAESRLDQVAWPEAKLPEVLLRDVQGSTCDFSNAQMPGGEFQQVELVGAKLIGIDFTDAAWRNVVLTRCNLSFCTWRGAKLKNVRFEDCELGDADFYLVQFESVEWIDCRLRRSRFYGARFTETKMTRCDLLDLGAAADDLRKLKMDAAGWLQLAPLFDVTID